ncbi:homocysteine S-methyltransferase family protein [SAR202 cluster bacterium AD-804-J14_MRT_500m]|nr:homocysteine S-methyltransferase family protein [SAR202 cluster bacterium AD-804-J14_MRT_500m]
MYFSHPIQDKLDAKQTVVMDGGTGTEISRRGVPLDSNLTWSGIANVDSPNLVRKIHEEYIQAGAEIIIANTFSTRRSLLARSGLDDFTAEINVKSVNLALAAREKCAIDKSSVIVAGSISTFEPMDQPKIIPSYNESLKNYEEQASLLVKAGVDIIILEMFIRTVDAMAAIEATSKLDIPIWMGFSCELFDDKIYLGIQGRHANETLQDGVRSTSSENINAYFVMHSPPGITIRALRELRDSTSLPIGAYAHTDDLESQTGVAPGLRAIPSISPSQYLETAREWVDVGAQIIGGCCGTTPDHIRALHNGIQKNID